MPKQLRPTLDLLGQRIKPATVSSQARTYGSAWMTTRARILARDCGLCQPCKRADKLAHAVEVDHITELADGGTDDDGNLQAICIACHRAKSLAAQRVRCRLGP